MFPMCLEQSRAHPTYTVHTIFTWSNPLSTLVYTLSTLPHLIYTAIHQNVVCACVFANFFINGKLFTMHTEDSVTATSLETCAVNLHRINLIYLCRAALTLSSRCLAMMVVSVARHEDTTIISLHACTHTHTCMHTHTHACMHAHTHTHTHTRTQILMIPENT